MNREYTCWEPGCKHVWEEPSERPKTRCEECKSLLLTFMCRPAIDEAEDKAA